MLVFEKFDGGCVITYENEFVGALYFDKERDVWVFDWGEGAVTYTDDLEETMNLLQEEFEDGKTDSLTTHFGAYEYVDSNDD